MKICTVCKSELPATAEFFNKDRHRKDGLQNACRECNRESSKRHYLHNKEHVSRMIRERSLRIKAENQLLMCEYLSAHPCVDCGVNDIIALDFDHQRDKIYNVASMVGEGYSWSTILAEIEKCEVVCANCHRRRTARQKNSYRLAYQSRLQK